MEENAPEIIESETLGGEVIKQRFIAEGKFCEKWLVTYEKSDIIMKVFKKGKEEFWTRERNIYSRGINYEHVLGIVQFETLSDGSKVIFTYYHKNGLLRNYLKTQYFNGTEVKKLIESATRGVYFLHTKVIGWPQRPSIVHRNITSDGILVNSYGECVICDFGAALKNEDSVDLRMDLSVCTPRYAPPEILNETITSFKGFQKSDIYSLGLVFWEICRRFVRVKMEPSLPFENSFQNDPTGVEMKEFFENVEDIFGLLEPIALKAIGVLNHLLRKCVQRNAELRPSASKILKMIEHWLIVI